MNCQMNPEILFVCGLAINVAGYEVALIQKKRGPSFNIGKWNGLGGKVKPGESARSAMSREFHEEAGVMIPSDRWYCFHTEKHLARAEQTHDPRIHFMVASVTAPEIQACQTMEEEPVQIFPYFGNMDKLTNLERFVYNMPYLLPMALTFLEVPQHRWIEG